MRILKKKSDKATSKSSLPEKNAYLKKLNQMQKEQRNIPFTRAEVQSIPGPGETNRRSTLITTSPFANRRVRRYNEWIHAKPKRLEQFMRQQAIQDRLRNLLTR